MPMPSCDQQFVGGRTGRRFSETISIDDSHRVHQLPTTFARTSAAARVPGPTGTGTERSELNVHRDSLPKPTVLNVQVHEPLSVNEQKNVLLKRSTEAMPTQRMELHIPKVAQHRRYSETVATDRSTRYHYEVDLQLEPISRHDKSEQQAAQTSSKTSRFEVSSIKSRCSSAHVLAKKLPAPSDVDGGSPPFFMHPLESVKVMDGEKVVFNTVILGSPPPDVKWLHDGKEVKENPDFRASYDSKSGAASLEITDVFPQDTGLYECIASNQLGMATVSATLTVERKFSLSSIICLFITLSANFYDSPALNDCLC